MPGPNEHVIPGERLVSWGKYCGKRFKEVPTEYLQWFINNAYDHMEARRRWAEEELERRQFIQST